MATLAYAALLVQARDRPLLVCELSALPSLLIRAQLFNVVCWLITVTYVLHSPCRWGGLPASTVVAVLGALRWSCWCGLLTCCVLACRPAAATIPDCQLRAPARLATLPATVSSRACRVRADLGRPCRNTLFLLFCCQASSLCAWHSPTGAGVHGQAVSSSLILPTDPYNICSQGTNQPAMPAWHGCTMESARPKVDFVVCAVLPLVAQHRLHTAHGSGQTHAQDCV